MNRRQLLHLSSGLMLSSLPWLVDPLLAQKAKAKGDKRPIALLLPLTGENAALGTSMKQAAMLAQINQKADAAALITLDTGSTGKGASAQAMAAIRRGVAMLIGPLTAGEANAAGAANAGRVPMIALTNDPASRAAGTQIFGITPGQLTSAVLRYARQRGVRRVLVIGDGSAWSVASAAAATVLRAELGIELSAIDVMAGQPLPAAGEMPDAVLLPSSNDRALAAARQLQASGVQLLTTMQGLDYRPEALAALKGAWLASIDPDTFSGFASAYEARHGGNPGAVAALTYDATTIALRLKAAGPIGQNALFDPTGFDCITGPVRFRTDGSCARQFAILVGTGDGYDKAAVSQGT